MVDHHISPGCAGVVDHHISPAVQGWWTIALARGFLDFKVSNKFVCDYVTNIFSAFRQKEREESVDDVIAMNDCCIGRISHEVCACALGRSLTASFFFNKIMKLHCFVDDQ